MPMKVVKPKGHRTKGTSEIDVKDSSVSSVQFSRSVVIDSL